MNPALIGKISGFCCRVLLIWKPTNRSKIDTTLAGLEDLKGVVTFRLDALLAAGWAWDHGTSRFSIGHGGDGLHEVENVQSQGWLPCIFTR